MVTSEGLHRSEALDLQAEVVPKTKEGGGRD